MRFAIDTGGTFTDLVVDDPAAGLSMYKSATTPDDPVIGVLDVLELAACDRGVELAELLGRGEQLIHATTRALNAVLTGTTARTGLMVTEGHEDVLVLREGGRGDAFDFTYEYPDPYVPRALTVGLPERIGADGEVVLELTAQDVVAAARRLARDGVEAVGVCLLWSVANPAHELLAGEVLARELPGVPVTLSHQLSPTIREFRRASATAIDASLRPLMSGYLASLEQRLRDAGFGGRVLVVSSTGGLLDLQTVAAQPIHTLNSGPSLAPAAGRHYAERDSGAAGAATAIVADTGGTSFDVSVVRDGHVARSRDSWLGPPFRGLMTGFASVDVRSIGAGGGSIAHVDAAGLLHVGPQSAGAQPGPAAYGRGGDRATLTDAAVVLGYIDAAGFLGGAMPIDRAAALRVVGEQVAEPLRIGVDEAAAAILELATQLMVAAIEDVTVSRGIDPARAVLVGGGGAAGLNLVAMAGRLGCSRALLPETGAALSAAGALVSPIARDFAAARFATTASFDHAAIDAQLERLDAACDAFIAEAGAQAGAARIERFAEARYPRQVWEIEVELPSERLPDEPAVDALRRRFHAEHELTFAFAIAGSEIEVMGWRARAVCDPPAGAGALAPDAHAGDLPGQRDAWFLGVGRGPVPVRHIAALQAGETLEGPAIVEAGLTTVVVGPGECARRLTAGGLELTPAGAP